MMLAEISKNIVVVAEFVVVAEAAEANANAGADADAKADLTTKVTVAMDNADVKAAKKLLF